MKVRTNVKAGALGVNRCEALAKAPAGGAKSLKVKTGVRAGALAINRCETLLQG